MHFEILFALVALGISGGSACSKVYFQAWKSRTETNLPTGKVVVMERTNSNSCAGYSTSTGKFTAPKRGPYVFTWTILTQDGFSINVGLYRNGRYVSLAQSDGATGKQNSSGSNTVVLVLSKGDVIDLRVISWMPQSKRQVYGDAHSTFAGWSL